MVLVRDAVLSLAPDSSSAAAGKKLADVRHWKNLGQNEQAVWGECQGSALYQVRADLATMSASCSCPSHKFPCKHSLALLLLAATAPASVPGSEPPEWVAKWLAKRSAAATPGQPKQAASPKQTTEQSAAAQAKRAEKRLALVREGLDGLDLWLSDLVRSGLSGLETQGARPWEAQAARLVDAQAPGVAARLRSMATIPGSRPDWPAKLLAEMGKLTLLTHAFRRLDALDAALGEDVRQLIGWTLNADEVAERGERVSGSWLVVGQWIEEIDNRTRAQRTWLAEAASGRPALILQFSVAGSPYGESFAPGTRFPGELAYWPSAYPLRARVVARHAEPALLSEPLPGTPEIERFLESVADALARQPWLDRFPCLLRTATPMYTAASTSVEDEHGDDGAKMWYVRDASGNRLPLSTGEHWQLLALSGGSPVDLAGEWDGERLLPLGVVADGVYTPLWERRT